MLALVMPASDKIARLAEYRAQREPFIVELLSTIDGGAGSQTECAVVVWTFLSRSVERDYNDRACGPRSAPPSAGVVKDNDQRGQRQTRTTVYANNGKDTCL